MIFKFPSGPGILSVYLSSSLSARSPNALSPWPVWKVKDGKRNVKWPVAAVARVNQARSAGTRWLGTCAVLGIREMAGDTEVTETGLLQQLTVQQMRVWTEDVNNKRVIGNPNSFAEP